MKWLNALDQNGHACDRDDTFNLVLHKGDTVQRGRPWGLTLRKGATVYRTTEYSTRENALKCARRLYRELMRHQPPGDKGHEVDPATGERITPCGCIACAGAEADEAGSDEGETQSPREAVQRWAPTWSAAGLKARGWTAAMIRDYLGEPDALTDNPHYRSAAPMRLYYQERCVEAEQPGFSERRDKAATRSKAGEAAAAQRAAKLEQRRGQGDAKEVEPVDDPETAKLKQWAATVEITWKKPPEDARTAIRLGVRSWEKWNGEKAANTDYETRLRWARNYLRHECMSYENLVGRLVVSEAVRDVYETIRARCEEMIDRRYPMLK